MGEDIKGGQVEGELPKQTPQMSTEALSNYWPSEDSVKTGKGSTTHLPTGSESSMGWIFGATKSYLNSGQHGIRQPRS